MNLHAIVSGAVGAVNPQQMCILQTSAGYTTGPSGKRTPQYAPPAYPMAQVQSLSTGDIRQLDALNIQGSQRKIYLNGSVSAIVRVSKRGGDLVTTPDGSVWLTTAVLEQWPDWCCVSVTLQDELGSLAQLDFSNPANSMYQPLIM